jgi:hypothetical protein|nr:MAG TPA: hypothetical protein [Caudoviricetes sp.]
MELRFYKEEGKWYIDIPWDGDKSDLEMVMGADDLLDELNYSREEVVKIQTLDMSTATTIDLELVESDEMGATYALRTSNNSIYVNYIWLCNVTKHVFGGDFPLFIHFNVIN